MCLKTFDKKPRTTKARRPVWKIIDEYGYPPYRVDMKYKKGLNIATGNKDVVETITYGVHVYNVYGGFLHAFNRKFLADECRKYYLSMANNSPEQCAELRKFRVVKMYIPVGAEYYNSVAGEICATQLEWE